MVSKSKMKLKKKESIKRQLLSLLMENDDVEERVLHETVNNANNSQEEIRRYYKNYIEKRYQDVI